MSTERHYTMRSGLDCGSLLRSGIFVYLLVSVLFPTILEAGLVQPRKSFTLRQTFHYGFTDTEISDIYDVPDLATVSELGLKGELRPAAPLIILSRHVPISRRRTGVDSALNSGGDRYDLQHEDAPATEPIWSTDNVPGPDVADRETVVNLAKMTSNAYYFAPSQPGWLNTSMGFNQSDSFGWDGDGLRGHVFADQDNGTIIVAFKGTTIDPREKWRSNDRLNDNLLFSCCCATQRPDPYWYGPVCSCRKDTYQCNSTCLTQELIKEDRYYPTALAVMQKVTMAYPGSSIWVIGHSLGGAMASLMGLTFNIPAVTYEAPPEKLAAQRLGLLIPPFTGAFHFGNTADPIFMGACNGYFASCSVAGYAFESQCFSGKRCVYDTVGDLGWHVNIANHRINTVITDLLEAYNSTPPCDLDDECVDCYNWMFDS